MHRGLVDHPKSVEGEEKTATKKKTGTQISIIYKALRNEKLAVPIMECLREALEAQTKEEVILAKL